MIGGADILLNGQTMPQDADLILRTVRAEWPHAMVQAVDSPDAVPFSKVRFPIVGSEFIVYRDAASFEAWRVHGATPENQATMMHLIITPNCATIVVDHENSSLASLAREMLSSLPGNRLSFAA